MKRRSLLVGIALAVALAIPALAADTTGITGVESHTTDEILTLYHLMELDETVSTSYTTSPDVSGRTTSGVLSAETQQNALDTLNFVRYIAGLSYDVTIDESYAQYAQDAAYALSILNVGASHYFDQASWMSDSLYASASIGAKNGNLSAGISNLATNIVHGWMSDEGSNNIGILGHRRWVLNPSMGETGFGISYNSSSSYGYYTSMYAQDYSASTSGVSGVVWPAQTMPVEYFDSNYPWSYTLGSMISGSTTVTITRQNDGETWTIVDDFFEGAIGDGYIAVNNDYYGQPGCISFIPDNITYSAGDVYQVEISGSVTASYTVSFFSLSDSYTVQSSVSYNGSTVTTPEVTEPEVTEPEAEEEVADISGASSWAQAELQEALDAGYPVALYPDQFLDAMTRGEFAHMLGLFLDVRWAFADSYPTVFTDLGDDAEQNYYINALYSWGIINGMTDTTFEPDTLLNREQAAKLLKAAIDLRLNATVTQDISGYADASSVSSWALEGVRYLNQLGVMNGTDDNRLNPQGNLTVQEAALMCYRLKP